MLTLPPPIRPISWQRSTSTDNTEWAKVWTQGNGHKEGRETQNGSMDLFAMPLAYLWSRANLQLAKTERENRETAGRDGPGVSAMLDVGPVGF